MCRFALYLGHPIRVSEVVTEPVHSLIHQSFHATERREPLNGDGFGVAWFAPGLTPRPALFKDVTPAWNNENLLELARVTVSPCILAHVRAASPGSSVHRLNCHPFSSRSLAFMHNGFLAGFPRWKRALIAALSDNAYQLIKGSTDSEHAFAVLCDQYEGLSELDPLERLAESVVRMLQTLEHLKRSAGVTETSYFNLAVADGERAVVTRYASAGEEGASLYYTTGQRLRCEAGFYQMDPHDDQADTIVIASERLAPDFAWIRVESNHMVLAEHPGRIQIRSLPGA